MADDQGVPHNDGVAEARARVELRKEIGRTETANAAVADAVVRANLGDDFEPAMRVLEQHLDTLAPEERAKFAGVAHDPAKIGELIRQAMGPLPSSRREGEAELEASRERMRKDPRGWHADERAQLRYRGLLELLGKARPR